MAARVCQLVIRFYTGSPCKDEHIVSSRQWLPLFVSVAPLFMWSVIRVQVVTSFEYCERLVDYVSVRLVPAHTQTHFMDFHL